PCAEFDDVDLMSALDRVAVLQQQGVHRFAAVNMSLGAGFFDAPCDGDPLQPAIENLHSLGVATVAASGNDFESDTIESPACIPGVVSVGATNDGDTVASFSNSASFLSLLAPGVSITSSVPG